MTEMIHHTHRIPIHIAITGGTNMIEKLSLTNKVAVLITAIANLILLNIQIKTIRENAIHPIRTYDTISRAYAVSLAFAEFSGFLAARLSLLKEYHIYLSITHNILMI